MCFYLKGRISVLEANLRILSLPRCPKDLSPVGQTTAIALTESVFNRAQVQVLIESFKTP